MVFCVAGDNGESWSLSIEERRQLAAATVKIAGGRVPVIMGVSRTTARQTIAYADAAATAGVDALMIGPQSYVMKATTQELVQRMIAIHRAVPLPIVLYNSPRRTNISLTIDSLRALTEAVNIIALKEASRDFFYLSHVIQGLRRQAGGDGRAGAVHSAGPRFGRRRFHFQRTRTAGWRRGDAAAACRRRADAEGLRETHYRLTRV